MNAQRSDQRPEDGNRLVISCGSVSARITMNFHEKLNLQKNVSTITVQLLTQILLNFHSFIIALDSTRSTLYSN